MRYYQKIDELYENIQMSRWLRVLGIVCYLFNNRLSRFECNMYRGFMFKFFCKALTFAVVFFMASFCIASDLSAPDKRISKCYTFESPQYFGPDGDCFDGHIYCTTDKIIAAEWERLSDGSLKQTVYYLGGWKSVMISRLQ